MAEEVASLGLKVSTDGIQEANDELNELAQVAPKVEKALEGAEKSAAKTGKTLAGLGQGAGRDLQTVGTGAGNAQEGIDRLGKSADVAEKALKRMAATSGQIGDLSGDFKSMSDSMARLNQQLAATITGMGEFGETFKKTSKNANDSTTAITKFFAAATAGVSVWSVINMADDWGQMASRVKMATKSQEEYNLVMERTAASAKTTYRDVNEVRELFILSASSIQALGYSLDETLTLQESFSNLLVTNAASAERGASAIDALSSSLISGVVSGEDWKRITTAMPSLIDRMSDSTKKSAEQIKLLGKEGKIALQELTRTLLDTAEANETAAEAMPATVRDAIQKASNGLKDYLGYSNEATGATQVLVSGLNLLGDNMNVVATAVTAVAVIFGARLTSSLALSTIEFTKTAAASVATSAGLIRAAAAGTTAATSFATLGATMRAVNTALTPFGGAFGAILTVAGLATTAFYAFRDSSKDAAQTLIDMSAPIEDVTAKLRDMSEAQRLVAENQLKANLSEGVDAAEVAYTNLYKAVMEAAAASRMSSAEMQKVGDELDKARINGTSYLEVVNRLSAAKYVPDGTQEKLVGLAGAFDTAKDAINRAWLELEKFRGAAATTPTTGAADDAANLTKRLEAEAAAMAQGAAAYKSKAQATQDLLTRQAEYSVMLKKLEADNKGSTDSANVLRDAIKGIGERLAGTTKNTNDAASAYKNWVSTIAEKTAAIRQELDGSNKLTESQKLLNKLTAELATGKTKLTATSVAKIKADIQELAGMEKLRKETERSVKAYQEWIALQQEQIDESVKLSKAREDLQQWTFKENEALKDSARILQVQASNIGATDRQRQLALATIQSEIQLEKELEDIKNANIEGGEKSRDEERAQARLRHAERVAQAETGIYIAEWDKTSQLIGQTLSDYIMGGGKDAAQYLKRLFATLVLQPIVNYGVQGVLGMFTGGAGNAGGVAGAGNTLLNNAGLLGAGAQAIWGMSAGASTASLAVANGVGLAGGDALGALIAGNGGWAGVGTGASAAGAGAGAAGGFSAAFTAALPWLAGGLALAGAWSSLFGRKLKDTGIGGEYDAASGFDGYSYKYYKGGLFRSNKTVRTDMDAETEAPIESAFDSVLSSISGFADALSVEADALESFKYSFEFSTNGKSEAEIQEAIAGVLNTAAIKATDSLNIDFSEFAHVGETSIETLSRLAGSLTGVNTLFDALGHTLFDASLAGGDMASQLADLFGGLEGMQSVAGNYLDNYYTEQERVDIAMRGLTASFEQLGLTLPDSKEALRELIEAQDLTTESGRETYASLLLLSSSFSNYAASVDAMAESEAELAKAREDARQGQLDEWMNLGGLSVQSMSQGVMDALKNGEDPGAWLADHITGGFEQAMQMQALNMVMQRIMDEALAPAMEEIMTDLFGEKSDSTATTAEQAVLKVFDAMDAAFASVTGDADAQPGGLLSLDTSGTTGGLLTDYAGSQEAVEVWAKGMAAMSSDAAASLDMSEFSTALTETLAGVVDPAALGDLMALLADLPTLEGDAAAEAHVQQAIGALFAGMSGGALEILAASGVVDAAFGGMSSMIIASSGDMLSAAATASVASSSAAVGHANAAITTIDGAVDFALSKVDSLLNSELGQKLFGSLGVKAPVTSPLLSTPNGRHPMTNVSDRALTSATESFANIAESLKNVIEKWRLDVLGVSENGQQNLEAEFAALTAQARLGDQAAAEKLPEIMSKLLGYTEQNSETMHEQMLAQITYMSSLDETRKIIEQLSKAATKAAEAAVKNPYYVSGTGLLPPSGMASFDVGTGFVPSTGVAMIHKGERIIPAVDNEVLVQSVQGMGQGWRALEVVMQRGFEGLNSRLEAIEARANEQVETWEEIQDEGLKVKT